jgi:hypothetical protein
VISLWLILFHGNGRAHSATYVVPQNNKEVKEVS